LRYTFHFFSPLTNWKNRTRIKIKFTWQNIPINSPLVNQIIFIVITIKIYRKSGKKHLQSWLQITALEQSRAQSQPSIILINIICFTSLDNDDTTPPEPVQTRPGPGSARQAKSCIKSE
jgi:hypothetical protein